jgi:Na+-driven multidrug efflux pump
MPAMSISTAVSALVGQNLGANKIERVKETVVTAGKMAFVIAFFTFAIMQLFPRQVFSFFNRDPELLAAGVNYMRYVSLVYLPLSLHFVLQGVLRGAGDTIPAMLITLGALWLIRVPAAIVLLGVSGVWLAFPISSFFTLITNYIYYKYGKWSNRRLVGQPVSAAGLEEL